MYGAHAEALPRARSTMSSRHSAQRWSKAFPASACRMHANVKTCHQSVLASDPARMLIGSRHVRDCSVSLSVVEYLEQPEGLAIRGVRPCMAIVKQHMRRHLQDAACAWTGIMQVMLPQWCA